MKDTTLTTKSKGKENFSTIIIRLLIREFSRMECQTVKESPLQVTELNFKLNGKME